MNSYSKRTYSSKMFPTTNKRRVYELLREARIPLFESNCVVNISNFVQHHHMPVGVFLQMRSITLTHM